MIQKNKKNRRVNKTRNIFAILVSAILILIIGSFLSYSTWKVIERRSSLISQVRELQEILKDLEQKNQELNSGISQLSNEYYLEKIGREKLGLKKPGEKVVVVIPPLEVKEEEINKNESFWNKIIDPFRFFFRSL